MIKALLACSVCFWGQDANEPLLQGLRWGVMSLLLVLGVVAGLFVNFFISLHKRSHESNQKA